MAAATDFVHLHLHTEYSLLDGASRCEEVAQRAAQWGMGAVALTDHGNMFGTVPFYLACEKAGVKPILGVESYIVTEGSRFDRKRGGRGEGGKELCHFALLCENETGYRNLLKIVSDSWLNGFYYKPRIDRELLAGRTEGLIALSACIGGEIPQAVLAGQLDRARRVAYEYRELFGPDGFFLELQDHHTPEQDRVNRALYELSRETGIPLVASNDVHYVEETDADPQDLLLCIQTGCVHSKPDRFKMSSRELFMRSGEQMCQLFGDVPETLTRTREIADRCNVQLKFGDLILPEFPHLPPGHTEGSYLRELCLERVGRFYRPVSDEVRQRLDYELQVIDAKGYSGYLLIVWDLIDFAKRQRMRVGPGRGSAAGSLVAYVLGITELDPLRYNLLFERFLNPERPSAPDIDIDFPPERRDEVVAYTISQYGANRTAKIITFGTMAAKAAIKDVGRVIEMAIPDVNELTALIPDKPGTTLDQALAEVDELRRRYEHDAQVHRLIDNARRLEGMARHTSIHAAAMVISRDDLDNYVPLCRVSGGEDVVTQFDMDAVDKCGLLKMDFLGLRTMTVIDEACRLVAENRGLPGFDVRGLALDDPKTYELIGRGDLIGVFQLESGGFQKTCRELKPDCIDDIVALVALYRPGPMDYIPDYIARKHGKQKVVYLHPALEPILEPTYGIIVYQEQVMQIGRDLAGFSLGEADLIRKAVGKKDAATMAKVFAKFAAGCAERGIAKRVTEQLIADITKFADYAFNKAHSACYAVVSYWTAYLKANYPLEFMAAQLTSVMDKRDKVVNFVQDTRSTGIAVEPPCVNTGGVVFEVHADHIVYGLAAINGVGEAVARAIVAERQANGPYGDLFDFCRRLDRQVLPKATVEKLIRAGSCRAFGNRRSLAAALDNVYEAAARAQQDERAGQGSLFDGLDEPQTSILAPAVKPLAEYSPEELRALDTEMLGLVLYEDPQAELRKQLAALGYGDAVHHVSELGELPPRSEVTLVGALEECRRFQTKAGKDMLKGRLNDTTGSAVLTCWQQTLDQFGELLKPGALLVVQGKVDGQDNRDGLPGLIVDRALTPDSFKPKRRRVRAAAEPAPASAPERTNRTNRTDPTHRSDQAALSERRDEPQLATSPLAPTGPLRLVVRLHPELESTLAAVADTLRRHQGDRPVELVLRDNGTARLLHLGPEFHADGSDALQCALAGLAGCRLETVNRGPQR